MDKLIVSMTSWKKRIAHVSRTIFMMSRQTRRPDKIYVTLSTDEFTNKELDLPKDLVTLIDSLDYLELIWVKENTKAFKKLIPALYRHRDEDCWIATVDDDVEYREGYLEHLLSSAKQHRGNVVNPRICGNWLHGAFGCYHTSYFKDGSIFKLTPADMIEFIEDDQWYSACYHRNGIGDYPDTSLKPYVKLENFEEPLSRTYNASSVRRKRNEIIKNLLG